MKQPADNAALVRGIYDALGKGDIPGVAAAMASDIVWLEAEGNPYADLNPYEGADKIISGLFARLGGEWDGFTATPHTWIADADKVVTLGRYSGKYHSTDQPLDAQFAHVWTVRNGKVAEFQQYTDTAQQARVMGR